MDKKVADLLKDQVNKELYSAYLYLAMANYYIEKNLDGFGNWFQIQAKEELDHGMMFLKYLQDNSEPVKLEAIAAPEASFSDFRQPLEKALHHERYVTSLINAIYSQAKEVNDYRCCQFLDWFIAEQSEEEKNTSDLLGKFDLFGSDMRGVYLMNSELKNRVYTAPAQAAD